MIYFIDDELFQEYQRESAWLCFPAQDRADVGNRGGLEGKVNLSNGSEQLVVCYPSLPPENELNDDDRAKLGFQEFLAKDKSAEVEYQETTLETEGKTEEAALKDPEPGQEQMEQTLEDQESVLVNSEQEMMNQGQEELESIQGDSAYGGMDQQMMRGIPEKKVEEQKTAPEEGHRVPENGPYPPYQPYQYTAPEAQQGQQHVNPMYSGANPNQQPDQRNQNTMPMNPLMCQRCGGHRGHVPAYYYHT